LDRRSHAAKAPIDIDIDIDRHYLLELEPPTDPPAATATISRRPSQDPILIFSPQILCEAARRQIRNLPPRRSSNSSHNIPQYVALTSGFTFRSPTTIHQEQEYLGTNSALCASTPDRCSEIGQRLDQFSKFARIPFALEQYLEKPFRHCWQYRVSAAFLRHDVDRNNDPAVKRTVIHARPQ